MQRNEVIIEQFIKTIKESPLDVQGDPVLLSKVFDAMEKKKKKRRFIAFFMIFTLVLGSIGFIAWEKYLNGNAPAGSDTMAGMSDHHSFDRQNNYSALIPVKEEVVVVHEKKSYVVVKPQKKQDMTVSYKFNNNQVEVTKAENDDFVQINIFNSDGSEVDVFKMMEELKKSYQSNEVYIDSVKRSEGRKTIRRPWQ